MKGIKPTLLGGHNIEGRADILLNFLWLLIFYLHILTISHCEIRPFPIFIDAGPVCINYIKSFL